VQEHEPEQQRDDGRDDLGRWRAGTSGNPAGRPRGRGWVAETRALLREKSAVAVLGSMHRQALQGNVQAASLILRAVLPDARHDDEPEAIEVTGTLAQKAETITNRMLAGELSPSEAEAMLRALRAAMEIAEVAELQARVAQLEGAHGTPV
jgi:hypothetical protein